MGKANKITIQDVANYAKVSAGTIDRVIHNRGRVSPEKRQKVEEAIKALNFNPNLLARMLALGQRYLICVLIPEAPFEGHYWAMPRDGIRRAGQMYKDFGVSVEIFFYNYFEESSLNEQARIIMGRNPDGVVLAPLFLHESSVFVKKLKKKEIPFVFIDTDMPAEQALTYIGPDVRQSACIAAKLLHASVRGEGDMLILHLVKGVENAAALKRMEAGFTEYFKESGISEMQIYNLTLNSTGQDIVYRELARFYQEHPNVKGVFVTNSRAYLVSGFHTDHNLDIKVVGYDLVEGNIHCLKSGGIDYLISQSPVQQGVRAVQSLFELFIYRNEPPKVQYVPLDIIVRENVDYYVNFN